MLGISGVDTRHVTRVVRSTGCINAVITTDLSTPTADLVAQAKAFDIAATDYIREVSAKTMYDFTVDTEDEWEFNRLLKVRRNI